MKQKWTVSFLLLFSVLILNVTPAFAGSMVCAAKTDDSLWRFYQPYWQWGTREWETPWESVRELASDDTAKLSGEKMIYTVPEGKEDIDGADIPKQDADKIIEIKLPESLQFINADTFDGLVNLQKITIPSGVIAADGSIFAGCGSLREIKNLSALTFKLPGGNEPGLEYYVDGKKASEIPPGKTAVGREKTYTLSYKLNGGTIDGDKVDTYQVFERETKLPRARRKGYIFAGWSFDGDNGADYRSSFSLYNENGSIRGNKTLKASWKKIRVKKRGQKGIRISVYNREPYDQRGAACLYSAKKSMKDAKIVCFNERFSYKKTKGSIQGRKTKNYTSKYYPKKNLLTVDLRKLKRGKTYYLQFRRINELAGGYYYMNKEMLETVRVKL